jgi:nucleotide-binding universal stress UspA family protein
MNVLLAYDGHDRSQCVIEETAGMADAIDRAVILAVVPPGETATRGDLPGEAGAGTTWEAHPVEQALSAAQGLLRDHGVEAEAQLRFGDPVEVITADLADGAYDLLLVGTRHKGSLEEMLGGSVSRRLVEQAPCPVMVVGEAWKARVERRAPWSEAPEHVRLTSVGGMPT